MLRFVNTTKYLTSPLGKCDLCHEDATHVEVTGSGSMVCTKHIGHAVSLGMEVRKGAQTV